MQNFHQLRGSRIVFYVRWISEVSWCSVLKQHLKRPLARGLTGINYHLLILCGGRVGIICGQIKGDLHNRKWRRSGKWQFAKIVVSTGVPAKKFVKMLHRKKGRGKLFSLRAWKQDLNMRLSSYLVQRIAEYRSFSEQICFPEPFFYPKVCHWMNWSKAYGKPRLPW